jgi:ribonuclease III family protein
MEIKNINTTALAYIGDAVYEIYVRKYVLNFGAENVDRLHQISIKYVRAEGQAFALKAIFEELTEDEKSRITSKPKNVDPVTYKLATAFEALVGYLYLDEKIERMEEIIYKSIQLIGASKIEKR